MSSLLHASMTSTKVNPNFDELQWVIQIRQTLDEEEHEDDYDDMPVCISCVPKALMSYKPEAFIPQQVALGPYHYWRPELYEMGRYKLVAAKKTQKLHGFKFENLVEKCFTKLDSKIRACYHKYIEFNPETLSWILAVDASFLLEFLQTCATKEGKIPMRSISSSSRNNKMLSHLMDLSGRKSAHNVILRDIMMLENQIPLFLLRKILEIQYSSLERADELLCSLLLCLCKEICPFKMMELESHIKIIVSGAITECAHLLDVLYHILVPKQEKPLLELNDEIVVEEEDGENEHEPMNDHNQESFGNSSHVKQFFDEVWKLLSKLNRGPMRLLKNFLISRPLKLVLKLPWTILTSLPGFSLLKQPMRKYFFLSSSADQDKEEIKPENNNKLPPLMEEITIPSVTELYKSGVRFVPTKGNMETIHFDVKTVTFYLPTISFDVNTEVILRNLVAYEASTASGPLVFTRYTELMNGIIDTGDDAKLLREKGIILNRLKSDEEVADLWNGMSKSIKLTKVPLIDKVIEDVNKYYSCRWKVKVKKFVKSYVLGSWKFLTFLAAILLLLLMGLQAFCSVYKCARFLNIKTV